MRGLGLFTGYWRPANLGPPTAPIYESIKEAAEANYGVAFGCAGDPKNVQTPLELAVFALEGNEYIPENTGKMNRWSQGGTFAGDTFSGVYNFNDYNQSTDYAASIGSRFRQHVLFYFQNLPNWLDTTTAPPNRNGGPTGTGVTAAQMRNVMISQMDAIRMNAPAQITDIEVINEIIPYGPGSSGIRESVWWRSPGFGFALDPDPYRWMVEAYKLAREYLPGYRLGINDFETERAGDPKADFFYTLIQNVTDPARVGGPAPIDWIGFQAHFIRGSLDPADAGYVAGFRTQMARINDLPADFEIHLTEMDYRMPVPNTGNFDNFDGSLADQLRAGDALFNAFAVALSYPKVSVLSCWGGSDARSWLYGNFPGTGCGLPYGWDYRRKPMWWGLWNAVANQCDKLLWRSAVAATVIADRDLASAGYRLDWPAANVGESIQFDVGMPEANTYGIRVGIYTRVGGGTVQAAISTDQGQTWTDIGAPINTNAAAAYTFVNLVGAFVVPDIQVVQVRFTVTVAGTVGFDYLRITPTTFTAPPLIITETPQHFALAAGASVDRTVRLSEATAELTARWANPLTSGGATVSVSGTGLTRTVRVTCPAGMSPRPGIILYQTKHNGRRTQSATLVWLGGAQAPARFASMLHNWEADYRPVAGASANASQWIVKGAGTRTATFESGDTVSYVRSTGRTAATDGLSFDSFYEFNRENFMRQKVQVNHTYRFRARVRASANSDITLGVMTVMTDGGPAVDTVISTTPVLANVWTEVETTWTPAPGSIPDGSQMRTYVRPFVAGPAAGVTLDVDRFLITPDNMNASYPV